MATENHNKPIQGLVQDMRKTRDQISSEIKDMTFEEERAYLDKLLSEKNNATNQQESTKSSIE